MIPLLSWKVRGDERNQASRSPPPVTKHTHLLSTIFCHSEHQLPFVESTCKGTLTGFYRTQYSSPIGSRPSFCAAVPSTAVRRKRVRRQKAAKSTPADRVSLRFPRFDDSIFT